MSEGEKLSSSLQESLLTLLCFDDENGKMVVGLLKPEYFEQPYRDIAVRALEYRLRFGTAPGKAHVDDLFDHVLEDKENKQATTYRRLLQAMVNQSDGSFNGKYVASRVIEFIEQQTLKAALLQAGSRYQQGGEGIVGDVKTILYKALMTSPDTLDPGIFLNDKARALSFLEPNISDGFLTGISELDRVGLFPMRTEMNLFMAPRGRGKSWWMVHAGKQALLQRWRVVHISLEMSEERVLQRYYQQMFAISKRNDEFKRTFLERDELSRVIGFQVERDRPTMSLRDPATARFLSERIDQWGARFGRLIVKRFASGQLTIQRLNSYLDSLATIYGFIPDALIIDYPDLMAVDANNARISIGRTFVDLRGIAVERNLALLVASQPNREGETARQITGVHTAEDISKIATADNVFTYSQTIDEYLIGLARLYVEKGRNDESKFSMLITQNYHTGQFVLDSARMPNRYFERLKEVVGELQEAIDE